MTLEQKLARMTQYWRTWPCGASAVALKEQLPTACPVHGASCVALQTFPDVDPPTSYLSLTEERLYQLAANVVHQQNDCPAAKMAGPCSLCVMRVDFARLCFMYQRKELEASQAVPSVLRSDEE